MMIESVIALDQQCTLYLNGSTSLFWDGAISAATATVTWIPLMLVLLYLLIKNNNLSRLGLIILMVGCCILLADQVASGICKPYFQRFRPTNDLSLMHLVDVVDGYRGGKYGFFSSHAANTFSVAVFFSLLVRHRIIITLLLSWAILNGYTRIYLGVHYCGDVLVGTIWGCIVGAIVYLFYRYIVKDNTKVNYISSQYTTTGYLVEDIRIVEFVTLLSFFYILVRGALYN